MKHGEFQSFVNKHAGHFKGPLAVASELISLVEHQLNLEFPAEFKWLLEQYGIWNATGIQAMQWILASTQRLNNPELVVLAQTTLSQFDHWLGIDKPVPLSVKVYGYLVWEFNHGIPGRIVWIRQARHEELNDLYRHQYVNIPHLCFSDFTDYITRRVNKLVLETNDGYQSCPLEKPLPEDPFEVSEVHFPWGLFLDKLGETISWNMVRSGYPLSLPDEMISSTQPDWISELVYIQETRRHMLLTGGHQADSYYALTGSSCRPMIKPAENLAGGDILLTLMHQRIPETLKVNTHNQSVSTHQIQSSEIILDPWGRPAPDYWVCHVMLEKPEPGIYLISWVPPGLYPKTEREKSVHEFQVNHWLSETSGELLHHFRDRKLIN